MKKTTLNNGVEMPILGFGVYQIAPENCKQCTSDALETGYRLIDTAAAYRKVLDGTVKFRYVIDMKTLK